MWRGYTAPVSTATAPQIPRALRVRALPGVWRPHSDARMLAALVAERRLALEADVLDVFTGTGALGLAAAASGARSVTAVDISRRALLTVRLNALRNGVRVRTLRGDLVAPVQGETFDLIVANPPYYPGGETLPARGLARAWEGGSDGRRLVDRFCTEAPGRLRPGGRLLLVHNTLIGESQSLERLEARGLHTEVLLRHRGPFGPVGRAALALLRERGLDPPEQEETVVISGRRGET
jgi:release factor glutamine methyltransferase